MAPSKDPIWDTENLDYVPHVTRRDVLRVIGREFSSRDPNDVLEVLDQYGSQQWHGAKNRVHLAILRVSGGDFKKLQHYVEIAKIDFRDVICPAEYPRFWKAGFVGVTRMSQEEVNQLKKDDWQQYQAWLESK